MIAISRLHHPVVALGPGRRAGIWVQGCTIGCVGCVSRDTWEDKPEFAMPVSGVMDWLKTIGHDDIDGITVSGGEPFQQPAALSELMDRIDEWRTCSARSIDVLVFSGYTLSMLRSHYADLLARFDAVVAGPFVDTKPSNLIWRGSANQTLAPLTPLGEDRYRPFLDERPERPMMQVAVAGDSIWWIGIPRRGDMDRLRDEMMRRGVQSEEVSW